MFELFQRVMQGDRGLFPFDPSQIQQVVIVGLEHRDLVGQKIRYDQGISASQLVPGREVQCDLRDSPRLAVEFQVRILKKGEKALSRLRRDPLLVEDKRVVGLVQNCRVDPKPVLRRSLQQNLSTLRVFGEGRVEGIAEDVGVQTLGQWARLSSRSFSSLKEKGSRAFQAFAVASLASA